MRSTLNGVAVDECAWHSVALTNYGHFTSLLVRERAVQGLDLHLQRLAAATHELFGTPLDLEHVRAWMRDLVAESDGWHSMRVTVFSREFSRERPADSCAADVLISAASIETSVPQPLSVATVSYQREAPQVKHVGTFGLFRQKRLAQLRGFDDALFVDGRGAISEGSVWNIGFLEDDGIVWPEAANLDGVSQRLLQCGLVELGIRSTRRHIDRSDLATFRGAFFTNSVRCVVPLRRIDDIDYAVDPDDLKILQQALDTQPWQAL